jgi:hypothetical protein
LVPPVYVQEDSLIHLRCVFLRGGYLDEALPAKAGVCASAIVTCPGQSILALVYDDAASAEEVTSSLVRSDRFEILDSVMFPLRVTAGAAAGDHQLRAMIPSSFAQPEYSGRIVQFRGVEVDRKQWDGPHVARCIKNGFEALIVHPSHELVVAVFGNAVDVGLLLRVEAENWSRMFGVELSYELVEDIELFAEEVAEEEEEEQDWEALDIYAGPVYPGVLREAIQRAHHRLDIDTMKCAPDVDDVERIAEVLIKWTVFSCPDAVRHNKFPDRAVLVLGIHPARKRNDLWTALSRYGALHGLTLCSHKRAALALFKRSTTAVKLVQERLKSCWKLGFGNCRRVPRPERATEIADELRAELYRLDAEIKMSRPRHL